VKIYTLSGGKVSATVVCRKHPYAGEMLTVLKTEIKILPDQMVVSASFGHYKHFGTSEILCEFSTFCYSMYGILSECEFLCPQLNRIHRVVSAPLVRRNHLYAIEMITCSDRTFADFEMPEVPAA